MPENLIPWTTNLGWIAVTVFAAIKFGSRQTGMETRLDNIETDTVSLHGAFDAFKVEMRDKLDGHTEKLTDLKAGLANLEGLVRGMNHP